MFNKKSIILIVIAIIIVFCISYIILNKNDNQNNNNENNYKKENFNSNDNIEFEVDSNNYRINKSIFYNGDLLTLLSNLKKKNDDDSYSNYNPTTKSEYDKIVTKIEDISPVYFENKAFAGKFRNKNKLFSSFLSSDSSEFNVSNNINYSTNKCFFELKSSGSNKKIKLHGQNKYISVINNNNFEFTDDNNKALEFAISNNNIKIISNDNKINNKFFALVYDPTINNTKIELKNSANNDDECIFFKHTRFDIILFENNIEKEYEKGNNIGYGNRTEINGIPFGYYQTNNNNVLTNLLSGCYRNLNMNLKLNFFSNNNPYEGLIENNEEFTNRQYTNILKDNYHVLKDLKYLLISRTNDIISNNDNMIDKILLFYEQNKRGYLFMLENGKNSKKIYEQGIIKTASLNQIKLNDFKVKSIFIDKYHEIETEPENLSSISNSLIITTYPKDSNMRLPRENSACSNIYSPLSNNPKDAKNNKDCRLECIKENDCRVSEYDGNKKEKNCKLYKTCGTNFINKQNSFLNFMDIQNFTNSNNSKSLPSNYKSSNLEETFTNYLKEDFTTYYSPVDEKNRVRYNLDCNEEENTNQNTSTTSKLGNNITEQNMTNYDCSLKCNNTDNCNFYSFTKGDNNNTCKLYFKCNHKDDENIEPQNLSVSNNTKLQCKNEEDCRNFKFPDTPFEAAQKTALQALSNSVGVVRPSVNISINETDYLMGSNYNEINKSGMFKNINNEIETIKR